MRLFRLTVILIIVLALLNLVAASAYAAPPLYLDACNAESPPTTCFVIDGFGQADLHNRTSWVLINDSETPATFSFYLYNPANEMTMDEIVNTETINPGEHFEYPGLSYPLWPTDDPLTAVITSTAGMTLQIVGPTAQCPRASDGHITCTEIHVPAGSPTYSFFNYGAMPDIVWIHTLYVGGVAREPFSDVMSGPITRQYATGMDAPSGVQLAAVKAPWKAISTQYLGGPVPPRYQPPMHKLYLAMLHR